MTKRKISVSLDEGLVSELEAGGEALSGQVNDAVRAEIERRSSGADGTASSSGFSTPWTPNTGRLTRS